jgi:RimJ/RimL family protein N-acetyltransferase
VTGLILLRRLGPGSRVTTMTSVFSDAQWPTKLVARSLACVLTFAFDAVGVGRVEGRSRSPRELDLVTGLGAVQEGVLRGFRGASDEASEQVLWSVLATEWSERNQRVPSGSVRVERDPSAVTEWPEEPPPGPPAWTADVPVLKGALVTLREVELLDASVLWNALDPQDIETAIEPAPKSLHQFRRYLAWAQMQRTQGRAVAFAIIPRGTRHAAGLVQVRLDRPGGSIAEWGAIVAPRLRGQGAGGDAARLMAGFAFDTLDVGRLESRASGIDPASITLLRKLGAVREAHLRRSFVRGNEVLDDDLWTILKRDWRGAGAAGQAAAARAGA